MPTVSTLRWGRRARLWGVIALGAPALAGCATTSVVCEDERNILELCEELTPGECAAQQEAVAKACG